MSRQLLEPKKTATSTRSVQGVPEHSNPLPPYYPLLAQAEPLTLRAVVAQKTLLRDYDDEARDQLFRLHKVVKACWQLPPTPMNDIPLGF